MDHEKQPPHSLSQPAEYTQGVTYESIQPEHTNVPADDDNNSARTASVADTTARNSPRYHESGFSDVRGGVNVQRAEADFAELSKELSRASNQHRRLSRVQSRQSRKDQTVADVEKAGETGSEGSDEPFDLEAVLRGGKDEEEAAGIKSKRIGVVWEDLTVSGIGKVHHLLHVRHTLTLCRRCQELRQGKQHQPHHILPHLTTPHHASTRIFGHH